MSRLLYVKVSWSCEYCSLSWMQWISCSLHPHLISLLSSSPPLYCPPLPPILFASPALPLSLSVHLYLQQQQS